MSKEKFQFSNVATISFAHLVHDVFSSFLAPLLPLLIDKHGISLSMAGLLNVFQRIPSLFNPFVGLIADKLPIRYVLILAPSLTAICTSLLGVVPYYSLLAILLFMAGIGASLFHVPAPVMIKAVSGFRIGKGMSFFMLGGEFARSLAPIVILGAVSIWGLEGTYKLIPVGLFSSFILYIRFRNIPISKNFKNEKKDSTAKETFFKILPTFVSITGIIFFISLIKSALTTFLPTFVTHQGESIWVGGISLSILQLAGAAGTFASGTISDKIGRRETLLIMSIVTPVLMFLFVVAGESFAVPLLLLMGFFMFASTPVLLAIVNDIDSEHQAFINGIFMTVNFVFSALAVVFIGILGDLFGLETAYTISPFLGLIAILFILRLPKK